MKRAIQCMQYKTFNPGIWTSSECTNVNLLKHRLALYLYPILNECCWGWRLVYKSYHTHKTHDLGELSRIFKGDLLYQFNLVQTKLLNTLGYWNKKMLISYHWKIEGAVAAGKLLPKPTLSYPVQDESIFRSFLCWTVLDVCLPCERPIRNLVLN